MNREKKNRPCFETEVGTPTLTIEHGEERIMLPYGSFESAKQAKNKTIIILFAAWIVELRGKIPEEVWEKLQLFDIKVLRTSEQPDEDNCGIDHLVLHLRGSDD